MPTAQAAALIHRRPAGWLAEPDAPRTVLTSAPPPGRAPGSVRRSALVNRLSSPGGAPLALIVAPPGFGKTSLLTEWAECDGRPFVWLVPEPGSRSDGGLVVADVMRGLDAVGGGVVVLDDAQLLPTEVLRELVEAVLEELPAGAVFAIASRTEPPLPIGRLRAHRTITEVRMADLAMNSEEAGELMREAGHELDEAGLQALVCTTGGWPVALYLAALSQDRCLADVGPVSFRGDDHLLAEYLRDEVLGALPADLRSFLLCTSVLDELTGAACDAVLAGHGSVATLSALARETELLTPLDPAHRSYRWHPLFREALRGELRRTAGVRERRLHDRAGVFYAARGQSERAIEHGCAAADADRVGELLWRHLIPLQTTSGSKAVRGWLSGFGDAQIAEHLALTLCAAHSRLAAGDLQTAERWAECARAQAQELDPGSRPPSTETGIAVIDATAARAGVETMRAVARRAAEAEPGMSAWKPSCLSLWGIAEHLRGDHQAAVPLLERAVILAGETAPAAAALALAQRTMIALEQQDWVLAGELADQAVAVLVSHRLEAEPTSALTFAAAAAACAHEGRIDESRRALRAGADLLAANHDLAPWYGAEASILLAYGSLWLGDVVGARTRLAQASRFARRMTGAAVFKRWFDEAWAAMDDLAEEALSGASALTIAELRVLRFLPSHRSFREIAAQLGVSANTVKTQAHAVYRKLGSASRSEAVESARAAGLLGH